MLARRRCTFLVAGSLLILGYGDALMAADDMVGEVAAGVQALQSAAYEFSALVDDAKVSLRDRIIESRAAVARSRALLERLNARKPCRFP